MQIKIENKELIIDEKKYAEHVVNYITINFILKKVIQDSLQDFDFVDDNSSEYLTFLLMEIKNVINEGV